MDLRRRRGKSATGGRTYNLPEDCPFCHNPRHKSVSMQCGHLFCGVCLFDWLSKYQSEGVGWCPVCKQEAFYLHERFADDPYMSETLDEVGKKYIIDKIDKYNEAQQRQPVGAGRTTGGSSLDGTVHGSSLDQTVDGCSMDGTVPVHGQRMRWAFGFVSNVLRWAYRFLMADALPDIRNELPEDGLQLLITGVMNCIFALCIAVIVVLVIAVATS